SRRPCYDQQKTGDLQVDRTPVTRPERATGCAGNNLRRRAAPPEVMWFSPFVVRSVAPATSALVSIVHRFSVALHAWLVPVVHCRSTIVCNGAGVRRAKRTAFDCMQRMAHGLIEFVKIKNPDEPVGHPGAKSLRNISTVAREPDFANNNRRFFCASRLAQVPPPPTACR